MRPNPQAADASDEVPEDLADLMEMTLGQCAAAHAAARGKLHELVRSQDTELGEVETHKQQALLAARNEGALMTSTCERNSLQKISRLKEQIDTLHHKIPPRKSRWLILEDDNPEYYEERGKFETELQRARQEGVSGLERARRTTDARIEEATAAGCRQLEETRARHDEELRAFHSMCVHKVGELETALEGLGQWALTLPDRSDGTAPLAFIHMGSLQCNLARWDQSGTSPVTMPWLLPVKCGHGLVVSSAVDPMPWVHSWIYGMLNAFPAGLLRLSLIDPGNLGRPFSRWLELGDSSANLIGGKIWTEPREIEGRLADLKEHVVRVTQRLLRDSFADLHQYNAAHPEAPEPVHLVVIQQPPSGWRGAIPEMISQLFINGPRCGVIPCIILPQEGNSLSEICQGGEFRTLHIGSGGKLEGTLVGLPSGLSPVWMQDPECGSLNPSARLREIAEEAARRTTVSVGYEALLKDSGISPADQHSRSTAEGLTLPLGRSETGAILRMELGTVAGNHHVLIGGRPSMGKSTLLHAIIATACQVHGPDELQVYLLDYKRGTEFMPYATEKLPHARVVSVESDREFGLSVLRFLDNELDRRSRLLKAAGTQDLAEYRRQTGKSLPRMILIIDEFQVLFGGKDSLADQASHMLDQLIRQGRSYGLHVILATQALSTGWSLSANTLSLISLRIALACDERVSRQILGEENKAAQLLSRPGEAVYNDHNGQVMANHRFQVVHFRREHLGEQVRLIAKRHGQGTHECVVFDGSSLPDGAALLPGHLQAPEDTTVLALGISSEMGLSSRVMLEKRHGQNMILFSDKKNMRRCHLRSIIGSLRLQSVQTVLVDAAAGRDACISGESGADVLKAAQLPDLLARLRREHEYPQTDGAAARMTKAIVLHAPQNIQELRYDPVQALGKPHDCQTASDFEWLLRHGPASGLHCIILSERPGQFSHAIDPRNRLIDLFDIRIATRMGEDEARKVMPDASAGRLGDETALLYLRHENKCVRYRPFDWVED